MGLLLDLILILALTWIVVVDGRGGWILLLAYWGVEKRKPVVFSHLRPAPPPEAQKSIATLESLGFRHLGEASVSLPLTKPQTVWVFVNSDDSIQAEVAYGRVSFSAFFGDHALVVTDYPYGEHLQTAGYQSHTATTNIQDALDYHKAQVDKFEAQYGSPHVLSNMADYVRWEVMGRTHYGRLKLQRLFWVSIGRLVMFVYGALVLVILTFSWTSGLKSMLADPIQREMGSLLIAEAGGLAFLVSLAGEVLIRLVLRRSRRDSRRMKMEA
jgi:hypothetical protein